MEIFIALFLGFGVYVYNTVDEKPKEDLNPKQCAIMCDSVKSYDEYRKRCECK